MLAWLNFSISSEIESTEKSLNQKNNYFANYFKDCSNNFKKTWQGIRSIINIKNNYIQNSAIKC